MISGKLLVGIWFGFSVAVHVLSQFGLWLWLVGHKANVVFAFTGIPGYIEKCYSRWAKNAGRSPDFVLNLRIASTINLVLASAVFIVTMQLPRST
jgi:hypothetical protein